MPYINVGSGEATAFIADDPRVWVLPITTDPALRLRPQTLTMKSCTIAVPTIRLNLTGLGL